MIKRENTFSNVIVANILAVMIVWIAFLKEAFNEKMHIILTATGVILGAILFAICIKSFNIPVKVYSLWCFLVMFGLINIIFISSMTITNLLPMIFLYFPIAIYFYYGENINCKFWEVNYYTYAVFLIYRMINSADGYLLFYSVSRNAISSLLLIWLIILYYIFSKQDKKFPLRCIIVFFVSCFVANGRGGIISALMLLTFYCLYIIFDHLIHHNARWIPWMLLIYFIVGYVFFHSDELFEKYLYRFTEYKSIRSSEARIDAWRVYTKSVFKNPIYLIFGANPNTFFQNSYLRALNGNLHNSFLSLHSRLGSVALITICWRLYNALKKSLRRKEYILSILIVVCIVRSMTDTLFPGKIADVFLLLFVFYSIEFEQSN